VKNIVIILVHVPHKNDVPFVLTAIRFVENCVPMLPVSLDCTFLITRSVFSNVYMYFRYLYLFTYIGVQNYFHIT
jgi:hypothetical protein